MAVVLLFQSFTGSLSTEMASGSGERAANDGHRGGRRYDLRPRDGDLDPSAANAIHPATSSKASAVPLSQVNLDELARRRYPRGSPISSSAPSRSRAYIVSRGQPQYVTSTSEVDDDTWEHVKLRRSHDKVRSLVLHLKPWISFCSKQHKRLWLTLFMGEHCLGCS